uniref:RNase H type-1 domain-containing protein n=1 Tax=Chenopodium quinoa TaxID=63459 RepID=A0A803M805_CHEQI
MDTICDLCDSGVQEDAMHLFLLYSLAKHTWETAHASFVYNYSALLSIQEWVQKLILVFCRLGWVVRRIWRGFLWAKWIAPLPTIAIDGSWHKDTGRYGIGWTATLPTTNELEVGGGFGVTDSALLAEALACVSAVQWAIDNSFFEHFGLHGL